MREGTTYSSDTTAGRRSVRLWGELSLPRAAAGRRLIRRARVPPRVGTTVLAIQGIRSAIKRAGAQATILIARAIRARPVPACNSRRFQGATNHRRIASSPVAHIA